MVKTAYTVKTTKEWAELRHNAVLALEQCLRQVPGAHVSISLAPTFLGAAQPDISAHLTLRDNRFAILAEVGKTGEPQYARAALSRLVNCRQSEPVAIIVFIAPYISPRTANLCREQNSGYLDFAGNCHIAFGGIYIHVEGNPNPAARSRPLLSLYQPKAERVLRVLLTQRLKSWRLQALAGEAKVSVGQVYKVKELLLEKEWLAEDNQGIAVTKPQEMLAAWAEHYRFGKHRDAQYYTLSNIDAFGQALSLECRRRKIPCAFTSFAAAARYAPHATYRRTTAYVHHELAEIQELLSLPSLQLAPVETGADVILLSPYDDGVFYGSRQEQDISLVSPLQTYLDLQSTGGRGIEAAEELLQKEIIPNW